MLPPIKDPQFLSISRVELLGAGLVLLALGWLGIVHFLSFHVLAELFAILVGLTMGIAAWHTHPFTKNGFVLILGTGFFWVALLDLVHMLAYRGMGLPFSSANLASQLWLAARFSEAILLLVATRYLQCPISRKTALGWTGLLAGCFGLLVAMGWLPTAYVEGQGQTGFKVFSEYVIITLLAAAFWLNWQQRRWMDGQMLRLCLLALVCTILSEAAFTLYVSVYSFFSLLGHLFKLMAFWLFYQAIILINLKHPFQMMSQVANSFDAISHPVMVLDRQGVIRQINRYACQLAGKAAHELLGTAGHDLFHLAENAEECLLCRHVAQGIPLPPTELEDTARRRWWLVSLDPVPLGLELQGMVQTYQEITQLKAAYTALEEKEGALLRSKQMVERTLENLRLTSNFLEKLFHTAHVSIAFLDQGFNFIRVNSAYAVECSRTPEYFLGKNHFELFPNAENEAIFRQVVASGAPFAIEAKPFSFPDHPEWGVSYWDWTLDPIKDEQGRVEWLIFVLRNVTNRVEQEQQLRQSEWFNRTVIENIGEGFVFMDQERRHRLWNPAMERLTGMTADQVLGRLPEECFPYLREIGLLDDMRRAMNGEEVVSRDLLIPALEPGGPARWTQARHIPMRGPDGAVVGVIGVVTDITKRKQAELEQEKLHQQALHSARLATLGALSVGIAHEVNNPNNAIALNSAWLLEGWWDAQTILDDYYQQNGDFSMGGLPYSEVRETTPQLLTSIQENSQRIKRIVTNMKYLVHKQPASVMHPVDLLEVVHRAASILQQKGERRALCIVIQGGDGLGKINGNPDQLEQVFVNLLANAMHALTSRKAQIRVFLAPRPDAAGTQVVVQDQGRGMAPEELARVEEPFFTTRAEEGGMGFGLSIIRNILELHGAQMTFASELGQGTTVTLHFPPLEALERDHGLL